jgi:hypothetical protein
VDLMNTTGCTVWQTEGPETRYTCIRTQQSVVDYLMGPASFEVHHSVCALHRGR